MRPSAKTRAFFRVVMMVLDHEGRACEDVRAFHAPSELMSTIHRQAFKTMVRAALRLQLTRQEFEREADVAMKLEAEHTEGQPFSHLLWAYSAEAVEIADTIMHSHERQLQARLQHHKLRKLEAEVMWGFAS